MSPTSFGKREREKKQQERAAQKRQRRAERAERTDDEEPDSTELLERFRVLSESYAAGAVDRNTYESERREIYSQLGLTDAFDD